MRTTTRNLLLLGLTGGFVLALTALTASGQDRGSDRSQAGAVAAFGVVQKVLQHPRCQNCHIPGDAPLQFDDGREHSQNVQRGADGKGARGLACATCHSTLNPPASYGAHMPPGAPNWHLPPPEHKMVFINLSAGELCRGLKNREEN